MDSECLKVTGTLGEWLPRISLCYLSDCGVVAQDAENVLATGIVCESGYTHVSEALAGAFLEAPVVPLLATGFCVHVKGAPAAAVAPRLRLKLQGVVKQAREHLHNNRVRISVKAPTRPAQSHSGGGGGTEEPIVFTDDLLGAILGNADLCEHLNMQPADISGRMQLYEALAINFVYDLGAQSHKVRLSM